MQKIEQFKITAHELADAASQTESFVNSPGVHICSQHTKNKRRALVWSE